MDNQTFAPTKILAPVAEGTLSDHSISVAVDLANRAGASLELLHVVQVPTLLGTRFDQSSVAAMNAERVGRSRDVLLAHLARLFTDTEVNGTPVAELVHVVAGQPPKATLERAREIGADLIVLGESGKTKNLDFGGVARAVLSRAECPIWLQSAPPRKIEHILAPVDLSDHSMVALAAAVDLARLHGAEVTALHTFDLQGYAFMTVPYGVSARVPHVESIMDANKERFEEQLAAFDWQGVAHRTVFSDDEAARGILRRQEEHDLIVMGTHGRTGLSAALLGGVAYSVMRSAYRPVLAIRQAGRKWTL